MPDYSDTFNRANSATSAGTPEVGGPYTVRAGTWGIISNALYTAVTNAEAQITFPAYVDLDFTVTVDVFGSNGGILFRWVDTNNCWLVNWASGGIQLNRRVAGSWMVQSSLYTPARAPGDTVRVVAIGRLIQVFHNTKRIIVAEDPFFGVATATAGFRLSSDSTSRVGSAAVVAAAALAPGSGQAFEDEPEGAGRDPGAHLYKGRDTKIADEGAVA